MDERRSVDHNWLAVSGLAVFAAVVTALLAAVGLGLPTAGLGAALAAVAVAAFVEAYLTLTLLEALFSARLE